MDFKILQRGFLAHLRSQEPLPNGFSEQGAGIYIDLLYNKFRESLELCFPVTHEILGDGAWQQLLKNFIAEHRCTAPYYRKIPDGFVQYLQSAGERYPLYLQELAHFEWIEMILAITDAEPFEISTVNDWLASRPLFVPVFEVLHYSYPVHSAELTVQQATYILGFRDINDIVQFIELNPATVRLLEILLSEDCTVREAIDKIAMELNYSDPSLLHSYVIETMTNLMQQGAIIGDKYYD